jgi:hypothetical protein
VLHENIVKRVGSAEAAERVNETVRLIMDFNTSATPTALWKSASDLGDDTTLTEWLRRFLLKADRFPKPPLPLNDPDFVPLSSGSALVDAGCRFQNCLASKAMHVLSGRASFYEFKPSPGAIASFYRMTDGSWLMAKVYGRCNGRVPPDVAAQVRRKVIDMGGRCLIPVPIASRFVIADRFFELHDLDGLWPDIIDDLDTLEDEELVQVQTA